MTRRIGGGSDNNSGGHHVVDFGEARAQKLAEKRKNTERIVLTNLISVYSMMGNGKMMPIELIDLSEEGCSFQVPYDVATSDQGRIKQSELPLRLYFSQNTYLEIHVQIQNSRPTITNKGRFVRFGCQVDQEVTSYPAYQQFVRFLRLYSEHAHKDLGDISVFYL